MFVDVRCVPTGIRTLEVTIGLEQGVVERIGVNIRLSSPAGSEDITTTVPRQLFLRNEDLHELFRHFLPGAMPFGCFRFCLFRTWIRADLSRGSLDEQKDAF